MLRPIDIRRLEALYRSNDALNETEIVALLTINQRCPVQDPAWTEFLAIAVAEYVVNERAPEGYVSRGDAEWLFGILEQYGAARARQGMEILNEIIRRARWVPSTLTVRVLQLVYDGVGQGGPLTLNGPVTTRRTIDEASVDSVIAALGNSNAASHLPISRQEIEWIGQIDCGMDHAERAPDTWLWLKLAAIANVVATAAGYDPALIARDTALSWPLDQGRVDRKDLIDVLIDMVRGAQPLTYERRALVVLECQRVEIITDTVFQLADEAWICGPGRLLLVELPFVVDALSRAGLALPDAILEIKDGSSSNWAC